MSYQEGCKVGLALGGGSMRGLAHIGVLMALEEEKLPIDCIAGCSMGSIIGAIYCCGVSPKNLMEIALNMRQYMLIDPVIPREGFVRGNKIQSLVRTLTQDKSFDQTDIPLTVVACALEEAKLYAIDEGKIHQAVRASIAIPGVFEPCRLNGKLFVDGGIMVRVPVQAVRDMGADIAIGVDVGYRGTPRSSKGTIEYIINAIEFMEWQLTSGQYKYADILISPDVSEFSPISLSNAQAAISLGYEAALEKAPAIREAIDRFEESRSMRAGAPA